MLVVSMRRTLTVDGGCRRKSLLTVLALEEEIVTGEGVSVCSSKEARGCGISVGVGDGDVGEHDAGAHLQGRDLIFVGRGGARGLSECRGRDCEQTNRAEASGKSAIEHCVACVAEILVLGVGRRGGWSSFSTPYRERFLNDSIMLQEFFLSIALGPAGDKT